MMGYYFNRGFGMMGFGGGGLMMIGFLILILIIVGVVVHFRVHNRHYLRHDDMPSASDAMKILDERYAKGEISDEEYKNKKANMRQ